MFSFRCGPGVSDHAMQQHLPAAPSVVVTTTRNRTRIFRSVDGACDVVLVVHRSARTQPTCACSMRHAETAPCLDVGADVTLRGGFTSP